MKVKIIALSLVIASLGALWLNGRQIVQNVQYTSQETVKITALDSIKTHPGKILLESKCYVCHNPTADHDNRLAPPMIAVKTHYLKDDSTLESFTQDIWDFVQEPVQDKTKMRGAVRRFGVMPYQEFKEEDISLIADYLFNNTIEQPSWFKDHMKSKGMNRE